MADTEVAGNCGLGQSKNSQPTIRNANSPTSSIVDGSPDDFLIHARFNHRKAEIKNTAYYLAADLVEQDGRKSPPVHQEYSKLMRQLTRKILDKHAILYTGMITRLSSEFAAKEVSQNDFLNVVGDELFSDNKYNWGRIVALYAFCQKWAEYLQEKQRPCYEIEAIPRILSDFVERRLADWIDSQGGWNDFSKHFPKDDDWEEKMFKGLLVACLGLSVLFGLRLALRP